MRHARGRKISGGKCPARPSKKMARKRLASMSEALRCVQDVQRKCRRAKGNRPWLMSSSKTRRLSDGFFHVEGGIGVPSPPKATPKNKVRRLNFDEETPSDGNLRRDSLDVDGTPEDASHSSAAEQIVHAEAGRPIDFKPIKYKSEKGYFISELQYQRLMSKNARISKELKALRQQLSTKRTSKKGRLVSVADKVAVASLLQAKRVSGSSVPEVIAICSQYLTGDVLSMHLFAPSTAIDYVRDAGEVCRQRIIEVIGKKKLPFFIGTDTSDRAGSIATYIISYVLDDVPMKKFYSFERVEETTAPALADGIFKIAKIFEDAGGSFCGFSSDAPNVLVGGENGVGVLLSRKFGRYIRHDRCEHHASACVLRVLESLWPAQMNVEGVTQLGYLCWYILNEDWDMYQAFMIREIEKRHRQDVILMIRDEFNNSEEEAKRKLRKPQKPTGSRWRTLSRMILFVSRYRVLLMLAFNEKRVNCGIGAAHPGSIAAMCGQWIKWAGSPKLLALLNVAKEFIVEFWKPHNKKISLADHIFGVGDSFKVFSRPKRSLDIIQAIDDLTMNIRDERMPRSFQKTLEVFGEDKVEQVRNLYLQLYQMARTTVYRNYGPYLQGVLVFAGAADPDFLPVLFEALTHMKARKGRNMNRTKEGILLQRWLEKQSLDVHEQTDFNVLSSEYAMKALEGLVRLCQGQDGRRNLVKAFTSEENQCLFVYKVRKWFGALSHTQSVEKTFLDWDQLNDNSVGRNLKKATAAAGKRTRSELVSSKAVVREFLNDAGEKVGVKQTIDDAFGAVGADDEVEHPLGRTKKKRVKTKRRRGKTDVAKAVQLAFKELRFTDAELKAARAVTRERQRYLRKPHHGVSDEMTFVLNLLDSTVAGWTAPKKDLKDLLLEAATLEVQLETTCSASCLKIAKEGSRKGHPGLTVHCSSCKRRYHVKCMQSEGQLSSNLKFTADSIAKLHFCCMICDEDGAQSLEVSGASLEGEEALNQKPIRKKPKTKKR